MDATTEVKCAIQRFRKARDFIDFLNKGENVAHYVYEEAHQELKAAYAHVDLVTGDASKMDVILDDILKAERDGICRRVVITTDFRNYSQTLH